MQKNLLSGMVFLFMEHLKKFSKELERTHKAVITTHHKPDADALGSSLGLALYLKKKGHEVSVITPTDFPNFLNWMEGVEDVIIFNENDNETKSAALIDEATIIYCLDFSSLDRINELGDLVRKSPAVKVLIDHHLEPEHFADYEFWDVKAAATAELIFDLIDGLGDKNLIDKQIAECLYAGIMTDTGQFKHSNTSKDTHRITAELIELGANTSGVANSIYDSNSVDRIKFLGYALSEKMVIIEECNTAYISITADELKKYHSKTGDTEGLVNFALSIEGIIFAAVIIDRTQGIKMSFRSEGSFSVNEFARSYFNGGGHKNASGGHSILTLEETVTAFEKAVWENKDKLTNRTSNESIHV